MNKALRKPVPEEQERRSSLLNSSRLVPYFSLNPKCVPTPDPALDCIVSPEPPLPARHPTASQRGRWFRLFVKPHFSHILSAAFYLASTFQPEPVSSRLVFSGNREAFPD